MRIPVCIKSMRDTKHLVQAAESCEKDVDLICGRYVVNAKSISKNGGKCTYRSLVRINENAKNSKSSVSCESLMLDDISISDTIPTNDIRTDEVEFSHEAKIGKISDKTIFYLMSRGLSEEDAKAMIVRGFAYPISKELPIEYAVEMNNLINMELEGAIG